MGVDELPCRKRRSATHLWMAVFGAGQRLYMGCMAIFVASFDALPMATSLGLLIVFPVLQGLGGGGLQPSVQAILAAGKCNLASGSSGPGGWHDQCSTEHHNLSLSTQRAEW